MVWLNKRDEYGAAVRRRIMLVYMDTFERAPRQHGALPGNVRPECFRFV
jgi:hypothetical protein